MSILNERVMQALKKSNIPTKDLVQATNSTRATVAKWKRGENISISAENLYAISAATDIPMEWFITGKEQKTPAPKFDEKRCPISAPKEGTELFKLKAPHQLRSIDMPFIKFSSVPINFPAAFYSSLNTTEEQCTLARAETDSMSPLIRMGDCIMIDKGSPLLDSKIYLIAFPEASFARIYKVTLKSTGGMICTPENKAYPCEDVSAEDLAENRVLSLGRIIFHFGRD